MEVSGTEQRYLSKIRGGSELETRKCEGEDSHQLPVIK
jgi:hypothetical protein